MRHHPETPPTLQAYVAKTIFGTSGEEGWYFESTEIEKRAVRLAEKLYEIDPFSQMRHWRI